MRTPSRHLALAVAIALPLAACGGGSSSGGPASAGGGGGGGHYSAFVDKGEPEWVVRGSVAVTGESGRMFYGVGAASGIKNPAMLRSTADNRARNELAKVFEVFSASLMKDYMASTGEQNVENAIKTVTGASMEGVQVVDRYIADDGTMYALAVMDLAVVKAVKDAKSLGAVATYVEKVNVDDIFDQHSKKETPPKREPPKASSDQVASAPPAPASASSGAKETKGAKPGWVDGEDSRFPWRVYLCAVGFGPERGMAERAGYAALSQIFVARVASVSKDFMGAYSKTGSQPLEVQNTSTLTEVSTAKIFSGVRIPEVWNSGQGTVYALACLERAPTARVLEQQMDEQEETATKRLETARGTDKAGRVRELSKALEAIVHREALNGELRIVNADGLGRSGKYSHVDVSAALEAAVEALKVGVVAKGPYDGDFRGALIEGLTKRGYKVSEGEVTGMDVLVHATIRIEDGGKGTGSRASMHFARGVIQVEVKNVAQSSVLASFNESRKEGHRSKDEAERRAVRTLAKKLVGKVGAKIDKAMKR